MLRTIAFKVGYAAACAAFLSVAILAIHIVLWFAAWFAFGDSVPTPWPLVRFFLFLGWVASVIVGLIAPVDGPATLHPESDA
jgi:hypothetical protein